MKHSGVSDGDEAVRRIKSGLGDRLLELHRPSTRRSYLRVDPDLILLVAKIMSEDLQARFQTASAVDGPRQIEILYHWALDACGLVLTVRTRIDRRQPKIASITPTCPAAHWIEREMWELMGIEFRGHPDLRHLLLADDWPSGKFPLRRDFQNE